MTQQQIHTYILSYFTVKEETFQSTNELVTISLKNKRVAIFFEKNQQKMTQPRVEPRTNAWKYKPLTTSLEHH